MTETRGDGDLGDVAGLVEHAAAVAASWSASASTATSVGQERGILRLFGVHGLDRAGRPLAAEVLNRWLTPDPRRLASGIALPFAVALAEYDLPPQELALEIAGGGIDLGLEAELLAEPGRRNLAEAEAARLARLALERIDANRTARRELLAVLGDPPRPLVGASLVEPAVGEATEEAVAAITAGVDLVRAEVPPVRELTERMTSAGLEAPLWHPRTAVGVASGAEDGEPAPTGSQRGLATLRRTIDEAAAERRSYVRLATSASPLAAPEQAVVAGFERIDIVFADVMAEILGGHIDPDRALADHAFAQRLVARAGAGLLVGPGPLVVGPEVASGFPSDPTTRAGRGLALQLLGIHLARRHGLEPGAILVDVLPSWLVAEPWPGARALAELAVRRATLPDHPLVFVEPSAEEVDSERWFAIVAALLPDVGSPHLVVRRPGTTLARRVRAVRSASAVAIDVAAARTPPQLRGPALEHARAAIAAAARTIESLSNRGWRAVLGDAIAITPASRMGADAVVERSDAFDPFGELVAG